MIVVRMDRINETAELLFESDSYTECEMYVEQLDCSDDIEICDRY